MATAKKQPSGMWKCRVYSHTSPDGKKHYKAFTAPTKTEAETMASKFSGKLNRASHVDLTVAEAIDGYITARTGVLSPSSIRGYRQMEKKYFDTIGRKKIRKLTTAEVQTWVSDLAQTKSAKTTMNIYGLLTSSVAFYVPEISWRIKLPPKEIKRAQMITNAELKQLYDAATGDLKICIGLSAYGSLRRGEICALEYQDIIDGVIYVHSDLVRDESGNWVKKALPKTYDSVRYVSTVPDTVLALIGTGEPDERIIKFTNPNELTKAFCKLRDDLGIDCRFQDMRGFFASSAVVMGVGDIYAADMGGWRRGSQGLKRHYQKNMDDASAEYAQKMKAFFESMT